MRLRLLETSHLCRPRYQEGTPPLRASVHPQASGHQPDGSLRHHGSGGHDRDGCLSNEGAGASSFAHYIDWLPRLLKSDQNVYITL